MAYPFLRCYAGLINTHHHMFQVRVPATLLKVQHNAAARRTIYMSLLGTRIVLTFRSETDGSVWSVVAMLSNVQAQNLSSERSLLDPPNRALKKLCDEEKWGRHSRTIRRCGVQTADVMHRCNHETYTVLYQSGATCVTPVLPYLF